MGTVRMSLCTECGLGRLHASPCGTKPSRTVGGVLHDTDGDRENAYPLARLTSVMSVNAAISASVVLASRLVDDISVFALILFSIEAFALFPLLRRRLQVRTYDQSYRLSILTCSVLDGANHLSESHGLLFCTCCFSHYRAVAHGSVPVRGHVRFPNPDRTLSVSLGEEVQEVSFQIISVKKRST